MLTIQFPEEYNPGLNYITNVNAYSKSFDFLKDESTIYFASDVKKKYVLSEVDKKLNSIFRLCN